MAEKRSFSLTSFFTEHSNLFVVISVFSGLLVFFTELISKNPEDIIVKIEDLQIRPLEYTIVACYIIVLTATFLLLYNLFREDDKLFPIDYITTLDGIKRFWLAVPLFVLFLGCGAYVILSYPTVLWAFAISFMAFLGFVVWGISIISWANLIDRFTKCNGRGFPSLLAYSLIMLVILGFSLFFADLYLSAVRYHEVYLAVRMFLGVIGSGIGVCLVLASAGCLYLMLRFIYRKTLGIFQKISRRIRQKKDLNRELPD